MKTLLYRKTLRPFAFPLACLIAILTLFAITSQAAFASPGIPNQFYGTLTINGSPAPAGYTVTAKVNGADSGASTTTDSQGRYGYSPVFMVPGSQGGSVTFFVNGVQASQSATFAAGGINQLNLTVSGSVPASSTPPPTPTPTPTPTQTTTPDTSQTPQWPTNTTTPPPPSTPPPSTPATTPSPTYSAPSSGSPAAAPSSPPASTPSPTPSYSSSPSNTPSVAAYSFSDLTVAPEVANAGDAITATVRVVNGGSSGDAQNIVLKVNGRNAAQKIVTVDPGKSQIIDFTFTENTAGSYTVNVQDLTAMLQVQAAPASAPAAANGLSMPVIIIIAAGILLVIVLAVMLIARQRQDY
jgi:hypothetical protein